jgi:Fe-S cluster assembly protein SufD
MNGSNANVTMNGLSVLGGQQHVDNTTLLDHAMPHCESLELYKGIYGEKSQGVFSGTIIVREDAQKTNAIQSNRSILLSQDAQVNTKPQLKIWADDVKCTHGATIGQLDDDALFYIQARGVGKKEAKMMLVQAFAGEIIGTLSNDILKDELHERLVEKLEQIA